MQVGYWAVRYTTRLLIKVNADNCSKKDFQLTSSSSAGGVVVEVDAWGGVGAAAHLLPQDPTRPADPRQARHSACLRHQQAQVLSFNVHCTGLNSVWPLKCLSNVLGRGSNFAQALQ